MQMERDQITVINLSFVVHTVPDPTGPVIESLADLRDSMRRAAEGHLDIIGRDPEVNMVSSYVSVSHAEIIDDEEEWGTLP